VQHGWIYRSVYNSTALQGDRRWALGDVARVRCDGRGEVPGEKCVGHNHTVRVGKSLQPSTEQRQEGSQIHGQRQEAGGSRGGCAGRTHDCFAQETATDQPGSPVRYRGGASTVDGRAWPDDEQRLATTSYVSTTEQQTSHRCV
jgi:hypothetical protein